jgi:hypothetical protein
MGDERDAESQKTMPGEAPGSAGDKAGDMGKGSFEESHEGDGKGTLAGGAGARPDRGTTP